VAAILLAGAVAAPPAASAAQLGPELAAALQGPLPERGLRVIVTLRRDDLPRARALRRARMRERIDGLTRPLKGGRFRPRRRYHHLGGFAGELDRAAIAALRRDPRVETIYLDRQVRLSLAQGTALVGADLLHTYGLSGAGVNVAVIDSGVDFGHPDLAAANAGEQCFCSEAGGCCPLGGSQESGPGSAADGIGHGTSVAGIIASRGQMSAAGVAPAAGIVALRTFAPSGASNFSDIAMALEWLYDNRVTLGLDAVNLSLGDGVEYGSAGHPVCNLTASARAIEDLHDAGIPVFAASGNEGFDAGVAFPACVAEAIAVGGVYDAAIPTVSWCEDPGCTTILCTDTNPVADQFVCHTNSGSLLDVLAPDWRINVPTAGGGTGDFGGTSAAAPFVAGIVALMLEADPTLTPTAIRTALTGNGVTVTDPTTSVGYTRTDAESALLALAPVDADEDGVGDDGDGSGVLSDAPCVGGATAGCDDNCPFHVNADQADPDGDAIGSTCDTCPGAWNPGQDPAACAAAVPALSPGATGLAALLLAAAALAALPGAGRPRPLGARAAVPARPAPTRRSPPRRR
jgi:hypothetical protein